MKKVSSEDIKKDIDSAKKISYTPCGAKGIDKLKLEVCRGVRKIVEGVSEMLSSDDTVALSAIGIGIVGLSGLHQMVSGHGLPKEVIIPSTLAAASPIIGMVSTTATKGMRNLEAAIIKRVRHNNTSISPISMHMEQSYAR